ncbi:hypothetical protein [uncultured Shewanella sp.]|uniref:EamA family transporter n=1 Tax=uncultured Shewanella sp. TaxID=173975 RepID=UPI0026369147|nr:hypothetical protein [uncultured Shewanella sp.]
MKSIILGILASLLSAATAIIIISTESGSLNPLWLLMGQYIVGICLSPPRQLPLASLSLHGLRLVAGLWAFGAYYLALSTEGSSAAETSMILNTAPIFATFYAVTHFRARLSALLAFIGVATMLLVSGDSSAGYFNQGQLLALSAAIAYAASFIILGLLSSKGESPKTTNSIYNLCSCVIIAIILCIIQPPLPPTWWPVLAVGAIAALRIQVITLAATSPEASARVSVLTNLAFIWLALYEIFQGKNYSLLEWLALAVVMLGVGLSPSQKSNNQKLDGSKSCIEGAITTEFKSK